jgi:LysM repeat protein
MSTLTDKYAKLIQAAQAANVQGLDIAEKDNILYLAGTASASVKEQLWNIYNQIDPDFRSGDLVLKVEASAEEVVYEVKSGDSLSKIATHYAGMTWQKIFEANKDRISNPNLIHPGQKLRIPL